MTNACCVYDFTHFADDDEKPVITLLEKYCKHWNFQLEKCPTTGSLHFQGRLNLKVKERLEGVRKKFPKWSIRITSLENYDNDFYVTKEDTRIKGPWSDTDEKIYIPRDIRGIDILRPWQMSLMLMCGVYEMRKIHVVIDLIGNSGKTTFTRYMMCHKLGQILPFCNDFKDIMRMVMDIPNSPAYFIDMPRAINKEKLFQFFGGIEMVKSGYAYDDRYHFKQKLFDPPNIVVFTNAPPDENLLSKDRWRLWSIVNDILTPYIAPASATPPP